MGYLILFFLLICGTVQADVYVVHKDGVIYSLSERNDAVVPAGFSTEVISKQMISDLSLNRPIDEYKFEGKKFVPNVAKIKAKEDALIAAEQAKMAKEAAKLTAIEKLKTLGLTEAEISALVE